MGQRCQIRQFRLDLNPQCMLIVTHQQAKCQTQRHMAVPQGQYIVRQPFDPRIHGVFLKG